MDKEQKTILKVVVSIVVILEVLMLILFLNKDNIVRKVAFTAPTFDQTVIEGMPENVDESLSYEEMAVKEDYIVYLCGTPKEENGILTLYFTSSEKNVDLFKIKIFDMEDNLLGESGLIEPNSYIKDISLNRSLNENEAISIMVMSYQKDTYYSNGSIKLNVFVN